MIATHTKPGSANGISISTKSTSPFDVPLAAAVIAAATFIVIAGLVRAEATDEKRIFEP